MVDTNTIEEVVLLNEQGAAIGVASKASVHGPDTPLHLAFSCYVLNDSGEVLITRRSLSKSAWPGVWSNSFCGHPSPAEPVLTAVQRRAAYEVGLELNHIELALPVFRYRAVDAANIVENEVCPVYIASTPQQPTPHPGEVMDHAWVKPLDLGRSIRLTPSVFSPWLVLQAELLPLLGGSEQNLRTRSGGINDSRDIRERVAQ